MLTVREPVKFIWDRGNIDKNWLKHKISDRECEEVFFDKNKKIFRDKLHSGGEERFRIIGNTKEKKLLFIAFTARRGEIRIISARKINKKEVYLYEKST